LVAHDLAENQLLLAAAEPVVELQFLKVHHDFILQGLGEVEQADLVAGLPVMEKLEMAASELTYSLMILIRYSCAKRSDYF
jgi:hypothetical protein